MKDRKNRKSSVLPADETAMFCTQIALVLKSGISLADGTEAIYSSCENGPGKKYFEEISTAVTQTGSLYEAVKQVGIFPSYMVEMTGIGERAGKLDDVMEALGLYYEREHNIKKSIKNAVLYPSVLLMMLAIVIAVLVIGVLPIFSNVFESLGIQPDSSAGIMMQAAKITAVIALILITAFLVISGILNYMDEYSQAGVEGLRYANAKGLPVIIMEPLRGGRLVNLLPESAKKLFRADKEGRTPAELALKWLYNQPEVTCVLSGMNSMEMVEQNLKTASESYVGCLTASDAALIEQVKEEIKKHVKVGCTGCGYCMPCPRGVDIPGTFRCYNAMYSEGKQSGRKDYLQCTAFRKDTASASQCVGCGKCEKHCPQHIEIRKELKCAASELEDVKYKVMKSAIQILKLW